MGLPNWVTLSDLAEYLEMTETEILEKHPEAKKQLMTINLNLTTWIMPNKATHKKECMKLAGLYQWDYMQTDEYNMAYTLSIGLSGFSVGNFRIDRRMKDQAGATPEQGLVSPLARQVLLHCGLLCRAVDCCHGDHYYAET